MRDATRRRPLRAAASPPISGLVRFAVAMARGDFAGAAGGLGAARRAGVPRRSAEETAFMLILHAGFPAALEGSALLARVWPGQARRTREGGVRDWLRRGARRCAAVYGASYPRLVANVRVLHPDLAVMMLEQGYGRVLSRAGLAAADRELVAVAVLAAGGWERQLVSHLLGAVRLGARPVAVRAAWRAGLRGAPRVQQAAGARAWRTAFRCAPPLR